MEKCFYIMFLLNKGHECEINYCSYIIYFALFAYNYDIFYILLIYIV